MPDQLAPQPIQRSIAVEESVEASARKVLSSEPLLDEVLRRLSWLDEPRLCRFIQVAQQHLSHKHEVLAACKAGTFGQTFVAGGLRQTRPGVSGVPEVAEVSSVSADFSPLRAEPSKPSKPSKQPEPRAAPAPRTALLPATLPTTLTALRIVDVPRAKKPRGAGKSTDRGIDKGTRTDAPLLSLRELQVLHLAGQGYTNQEIADLLFVSRGTINFHLDRCNKKLGVTSRIKAYRAATERGLMAELTQMAELMTPAEAMAPAKATESAETTGRGVTR